jgi:hypothetical protein
VTDFITKYDAYDHLRLDVENGISPDDTWLDIFIPAICEAVRQWLKDDWRPYQLEVDSDGALVLDSDGIPVPTVDSAGERTVRAAVRAACLIELERQYTNRGASGADQTDVPTELGGGYILGRGATALLAGLRKTTIA